MLAAQQGRADMVQLLLKAGASPVLANKHGCTVLFLAATSGSEVVLRMVLGCEGVVKQIDQAPTTHAWPGISPVFLYETDDWEGFTPLCAASLLGHTDCVRVLLDAGAAIDGSGPSPLVAAVQGDRHEAVIKLLLARMGDEQPLLVRLVEAAHLPPIFKDDKCIPRLVLRELQARGNVPPQSHLAAATEALAKLESKLSPALFDELGRILAAAQSPVPRWCASCLAMPPKPLKCGRCLRVYYCDINCQKKAWETHKLQCSEAPTKKKKN